MGQPSVAGHKQRHCIDKNGDNRVMYYITNKTTRICAIYATLVILAVTLSGCGHWKWVMKHQDEVCAKCPQKQEVTTTQSDTTYYSIIQADTLTLDGLDWPSDNTVLVDNTQYKIIKEKGRVVVITKERRVPVTVTRYRNTRAALHTVKIKQPYVPFWYWLLLPVVFMAGFYVRKMVWR